MTAQQGKRLTTILEEKGWTSRDTLTTVLSFHLEVPVADPRQVEVDPEAVKLVPEAMAVESNVLPLSTDRDGTLRVMMEDPGDFDIINRLATLTGRQIKAVLPIGEGLDELVKRNYATGAGLGGAIDIAVEVPPESGGSVVIEAGGVEVALDPGVTLSAGPRGVKQLAIERLNPYADESPSIANALGQLVRSLLPNRWVDDLHLSAEEGEDAFESERHAVEELADVLDSHDDDDDGPSVSAEAVVAASLTIDALVLADRLLAQTALDDSYATITLDPQKFNEVSRKQAEAQRALDSGGAERAKGHHANAIRDYQKAWERAQDALEEAVKAPEEPKGKK